MLWLLRNQGPDELAAQRTYRPEEKRQRDDKKAPQADTRWAPEEDEGEGEGEGKDIDAWHCFSHGRQRF